MTCPNSRKSVSTGIRTTNDRIICMECGRVLTTSPKHPRLLPKHASER